MLSFNHKRAGVSELADETDSKSVVREGVWVRVPPPALRNRVEGSRMAPPLPLHRTYGSRIRRYINCKSISDFIEIVCKGVDKSRIDRDFPLAF